MRAPAAGPAVSDRATLDAELAAGLAALGLPGEAALRAKLLDYLELLARWNTTYNLTAVREPQAMVARHLLDSLAIAPHVHGDAIADLGSGPGLPGIPLAILFPARRVLLVEANGKKARFLRECARRLPLPNVEVVEARAEGAHPVARVPCVVARALAALPELVRLAEPWLAPGGKLLAMKGPGHEDERRGLAAGWVVEATHGITVPGLDAGRFLVVLKQARVGEPG
jgi:16S rRNA (guanine527-N7)-methyltransferase